MKKKSVRIIFPPTDGGMNGDYIAFAPSAERACEGCFTANRVTMRESQLSERGRDDRNTNTKIKQVIKHFNRHKNYSWGF